MPVPSAARVLIVSFDGMRPDAIAFAPMPNLLALIQISAYSLSAQTIFPSTTLPAHTSMLSGLCPSKHGVTWDDTYRPEMGYTPGTDIFDLAHAAGLRTVMIVGKEKLKQIADPATVDIFILDEKGEASIAQNAIQQMQIGFGVMFVHFPNPDLRGHHYGWLSPEQFQALRDGDAALGQILAALDTDGLRDSTLIIVTADHGGHATTHGTDLPDDMTIPWIASGPFIHPGLMTSSISTTDTAATAAFVLGLPLPADWDGRPVMEAFGGPPSVRVGNVCSMTP
jgi:predicted AlkP superfamily pyrophosphatase or phosphodiesterase